MVRPSEPEKKDELARRAVEVLQREGLELSVARLAEAIGVKRPTLLYHFPTYSHLVETALVALLTEQAAFVLERMNAQTHPIDRVYAHLRAVHAFHHGREERIVFLTQAIAATAGARLQELLAAGDAVFEAHRRTHLTALREGIAAGTVAPCDPEAVLALVRAVIDGLMIQRVMHRRALEPVHELLWERVLAPLKVQASVEKPATKKTQKPVPRRTRTASAARKR